MHQALYRKWRPKTFDDVCGQEHVTAVLRHEVKENALSHAYLFCGSRGTGKTSCAKILAKAVNCLSPKNGSPCGECEACRLIDSGAATDVLEMDAASNNGVESIRDIRDEVVYSPSNLRYRVYIVDEVHMLSTSAFNALLKTLEEPPAHVIFILATTELHKLPATIISRCQRFDFRRIALPVLAARVSQIAAAEGMELEPAAAERIARMAQGGMRDAISLLELCGSAGKKIDIATVNEMMGSAGRDEMLRVVDAIVQGDFDTLLSIVDDAVNSSRDLSVFWQDLIGVYRDLLVIKTAKDAGRYLDLTDAESARMTELAECLKKGRLLAHCRLLEEALLAMTRANAIKRMVAEMTLIRMCDPLLDTSNEGLLARIERLEDNMATGVLQAPAKAPKEKAQTPEKAAPEAKAPVSASAADIPTAKMPQQQEKPAPEAPKTEKSAETGRVLRRIRGFMNAVERVRRENTMLASFLMDARALCAEDGSIILQIFEPFAMMMLDEPSAKALICRALAPELASPPDPAKLILELQDGRSDSTDTVLDELMNEISPE